jgi:NAD(P)-dependent dehydrogenase (short-subunit alcohol dehydrogenase family)
MLLDRRHISTSAAKYVTEDSYITGIGGHTARAFAEANCARIAITDLSDGLLGETASALKEINPSCTIYAEAGDISSPGFVTGFFSNVKDKFGRIDYAVNCAGVLGPDGRSHELSLESFDLVNQVNYRGCWLSSRAELGIMVAQSVLSVDPEGQTAQPGPARAQQRGAIVNVASQLGIVGRSTARKSSLMIAAEIWNAQSMKLRANHLLQRHIAHPSLPSLA